MGYWLSFPAALIFAASSQAACLNVSKPESPVTLEGKLFSATVEGAAEDSAAETIYILQLPQPICIEDGGEFADPKESFDQVHVYSLNGLMLKMLKRKLGKGVHIEGNGFAAHTIHHRRPLVVSVTAVR
jgi:hypothetical protein